MKKIVFFVLVSMVCISCQKEASQPIEQGIYEAYQQGFSEIITVTKSSYTGNDNIVVFMTMEEQFKFPSIFDNVNIETGNPISDFYNGGRGSIRFVDIPLNNTQQYTLVVEKNGKTTLTGNFILITEYNIKKNDDQICLSLVGEGTFIRLSPKLYNLIGSLLMRTIDDESLIVTSKDKDYEKYATIQGEIQEENIILYFYEARISRGLSQVSQSNANYLDIDRLREEMDEDDVLEFVRKAIYFKKKD